MLVIATIGLWVVTWLLWRATVRLANDASSSSATQGDKMERSIAEAAKAAVAMEGVAESMAINAQQIIESVKISSDIAKTQKDFGKIQLRAYVVVLVGPNIFQDAVLNFQGKVRLLNVGATVAKNLRWKISCGILPNPLPKDFRFSLPDPVMGGMTLHSQQDGSIQASHLKRVSKAEAEIIKSGSPRSLFVWGFVTYKDIFNKAHRTTFAQQICWLADENKTISVNYLADHNRSS